MTDKESTPSETADTSEVSEYEEPCDEDGGNCVWLWEDDGPSEEYGCDMYCMKCYRFRDWTKKDREEMEDVPEASNT